MYKNATKCNETIGKWCKNKHGASKIIDTFETYHQAQVTNFSGNCYKGYRTRELTVSKWRRHVRKKNRMKFLIMVPILLIVVAAVIYSFI
jgi:hypothetical protein